MAESAKISFSELYPILSEEIRRGNSFTFTAFGKSMLPFIRGGEDRVTLSPVLFPPKKNDVIFYRRNDGSFVLHRIVKVKKGEYYLCGDNQYYIEKGICEKNIIALLTGLERKGEKRKLHSFSHKLWCFFLPIRRFYLHVLVFLRSRIKK